MAPLARLNRATVHQPAIPVASSLFRDHAAAMASHKLLYALISRGTVVLAEHSTVSGNANTIAIRILERLPTEDTRVTYAQDRHMFHVMVAGGVTYLCMAEEAAGRRVPYAFLEDIKNSFMAKHAADFAQALCDCMLRHCTGIGCAFAAVPHFGWFLGAGISEAAAYALNTEFAPLLAQRMDYFSSDPSADVINRVRGEITQVKDVMIENIEKVLDRGERLDLLVDKTEALQGEAWAFRREAKRARRVMWWQNVRMWFIVGGVVAAVVFFIVLLACGWNFRHC